MDAEERRRKTIGDSVSRGARILLGCILPLVIALSSARKANADSVQITNPPGTASKSTIPSASFILILLFLRRRKSPG
jgi:hypothetical protein